MAAQRGPHPLGVKRAAAERDHAALGRVEQAGDQRLLAGAERRLPLAVEERGDRLAELGLEQPVGVAGRHAERRRHLARGGRLARAHEADEDDGAAQGRLHPIRSR